MNNLLNLPDIQSNGSIYDLFFSRDSSNNRGVTQSQQLLEEIGDYSWVYNVIMNITTRILGFEPPRASLSERIIKPLEIEYSRGKPRRNLSVKECMQKMLRNSEKAIREHPRKNSADMLFFPSIEELESHLPKGVLYCSHVAAAEMGIRSSMEDTHFYMDVELEGILAGVLDGHGGKEVAEYASKRFQEEFFQILQETDRNVHQTFELIIDKIQKEIEKHTQWNFTGSTAVVSFIDRRRHLIYTATLGDSEAFFCVGNESIPFSCVRDWSSQKDGKRVAQSIGKLQPAKEGEKSRYFIPGIGSTNVSRAFGDLSFRGTEKRPGIIHKAKITVNLLKEEGVLILGCDGFWDFVTQQELVGLIQIGSFEELAKKLVKYAIDKKSDDNVSILALNLSFGGVANR
jgi:serine/threonine protein phosphatase PrpC